MFDGFTSPCTTPRACALPSASHTAIWTPPAFGCIAGLVPAGSLFIVSQERSPGAGVTRTVRQFRVSNRGDPVSPETREMS